MCFFTNQAILEQNEAKIRIEESKMFDKAKPTHFLTMFFSFFMQKSFLWALVSRRSRFQTGTRFFARGSDRNGNVANFCETVRYYEISSNCNDISNL